MSGINQIAAERRDQQIPCQTLQVHFKHRGVETRELSLSEYENAYLELVES